MQCYKLPNNLVSFSSQTKLVFSETKQSVKCESTPCDSCEDIWKKARKEYNKNIKSWGASLRSIDKDADRIIIHVGKIFVKKICYNAKKLGMYGICETNLKFRKQRTPVTWGFCSRACSFPEAEPLDEEFYEFMEGKYLEKAPTESVYTKGTFKFHDLLFYFTLITILSWI